MALPQFSAMKRATSYPTSVPNTLELPRRSMDCPSPLAARSCRRASIDFCAASTGHAVATSELSRKSRDGIVIEVGRSVDLNEERRRLERNWNKEGLLNFARDLETRSFLSEQENESCSSSTEGAMCADPRYHLKQRWREQIAQLEKDNHGTRLEGSKSRRQQHPVATNRSASRWRRRKTRVQAEALARQHSHQTEDEEADAKFLGQLNAELMQHRANHNLTVSPLLGSIFDSWGYTGLLTRDDELRLGTIVQLGLKVQRKLNSAEQERGCSLSPEEKEVACGFSSAAIQLRLQNQSTARQLLLQYNLRLLANVARKFLGRGMDIEDLIVEGTEGLEEAIDRYDPRKGYKFSTYAYMWIRRAVSRCISDNARVVSLPSHVYEYVGRIKKVTEALAKSQPDVAVTNEQVGAALGLPLDKVALYRRAAKSPSSLDDPVRGPRSEESGALEEILPGSTLSAEEELVEEEASRLMRQDVDAVLSGLSLRERNVLRYRYGLHTDAVSLADLSAAYGLTKERIRQIGELALAKLQLRQASRGASASPDSRQLPILKPETYCYHL